VKEEEERRRVGVVDPPERARTVGTPAARKPRARSGAPSSPAAPPVIVSHAASTTSRGPASDERAICDARSSSSPASSSAASVTADAARACPPYVSRGTPMEFLGGLYKMHPALDSIALDGRGEWLYYGATSNDTLYRMRTRDFHLAHVILKSRSAIAKQAPYFIYRVRIAP